MVKLVNRELENQILKIDQENKILKNKVAELQKKIQAPKNEIDEDLVGAKAITKNQPLNRKWYQMQIVTESVQKTSKIIL